MIRKKTGLFTFLFSLFPGAGEMYMGFYKQGISIMLYFLGVIFISSAIHLGPLGFLLPLIWFYSFFHVHNLASMPDEEFYALEDDYLFLPTTDGVKGFMGSDKGKKILAIVLILLGLSVLWNNVNDILQSMFPWFMDKIYTITDTVPRTIVAIAVIWLGIHLIRGKKRELGQMDQQNKENDIR